MLPSLTWQVAVVSSPAGVIPVVSKQSATLVPAVHVFPVLPHSQVPALQILAVASHAVPPQRHAPLLHVNPPTHVTLAHGSGSREVKILMG